MGTRHLIAVMKNGKYPVAQYGQWDGYPSAQGTTVLDFLKNMDRNLFLDNLAKIYTPNQEQINEMNAELKRRKCECGDLYPSLSRDTGGKILQLIQDAELPVPIRSDISFAAESVMCEWAYVVDFDKNTFEVFSGFNHSPLNEDDRFFGITSDDATPGYYGVKLVHSFPLDQLPEKDDFVKICDPQEEKEEE